MAAYHFTAKIHSRAKGASAIRAAAYRAGERLEDKRAGRHEDYTRKTGIVETAILAPPGTPAWVHDRQQLWERVEAREKRKDAQLAQELEINLPRELDDAEAWRLITDFCREHLVAEGRVCDIAFHKGRASDGGTHPHAHILMPLRQLTAESFGEKHPHCDWRTFLKRRDPLQALRERWADFARTRAAERGIDLGPEWDHRSYATRGIELEGQPKHGATAQRLERQRAARVEAGTPAERTKEVIDAQRRNGARLLQNPALALEALTQQHSTFTDAALARYVHSHSADDQFQAILAGARSLAIEVGRDAQGRLRFSTDTMQQLEARMVESAAMMAGDHGHTVQRRGVTALRDNLSTEQTAAAAHLLTAGDMACLTGCAGSGKSTLLGAARAAWEADGYTVRGAALSGIAAEGLRTGSGIEARTLASLTHAWARDADKLNSKDILVVDEAGMVGSRDMAQIVEACRAAGAKLVLVGDPEQLQAIGAGAAYRAIAERVGTQALTEVRRQRLAWQQDATRAFANGETTAALTSYRAAGCIEARANDADARLHLAERWLAGRHAHSDASRIMLAHTNEDVGKLNAVARDLLRADGQLGLVEQTLATNVGERAFASGERLLFRRNDRTLDVRNGTIGTVTELEPGRMAVRLDDGRIVTFDPAIYRDIDHGYAVTVHKAQGVTVDEAYVLATKGFDRHLAYVAGTRHRDSLTMVWSRETFADERQLDAALRRKRAKDTTLDYTEEPVRELPGSTPPARVWTPNSPDPAPHPSQAFIDAHKSIRSASTRTAPDKERTEIADAFTAWGNADQPERSEPTHDAGDIEDMLTRWGDESAMPERSWERLIKRDRGLER